MKYGLSEEAIQEIRDVFAGFPQILKAVLYGSRAKGNYKTGSDIDLALFGTELNLEILQKIEHKIDDLLLPYSVDLSIYKDISSEELKEHINRVGIIFYQA
ncbi:nucleotidyltransferase domain-containing protein [Geovibrio ferrireducens]|uniref:nucleotidyltransferase domain-containing protein n=1 Tax=Geovibrio ferrireducens TaxID=46201 RepID=UPI00224666DA|nr:nucleotidyltransferase domain-containing protein [Geovibrio ferrireducens]